MKKLSVTIQVEFDVPDSWELVKHPDDIEVIKVNSECYLDMSYSPMITKYFIEGAQWSSSCSYEFAANLLGMVASENVSMKLETSL